MNSLSQLKRCCIYCSGTLETDTDKYCQSCRDRLNEVNERWEKRPNVPALHGLSDGPGSCVNEMVFERPDIKKEVALTLKKMEEDGKLNTPELMRAAQIKMEEVKNTNYEKVDYGKEEHDLERTDPD